MNDAQKIFLLICGIFFYIGMSSLIWFLNRGPLWLSFASVGIVLIIHGILFLILWGLESIYLKLGEVRG